LAFKPKHSDSPAPVGYRRYCGKSDTELSAAYTLIRKDLAHCSAEQVLNVIVELSRRGNRNQLASLLEFLSSLNSVPAGQNVEEYRMIPG
jgi:hypothetical protein